MQYILIYWTNFGSTFAVASSRIKILFFLRMALAKQTNCLCPTDRFDPPSLIFVSKPCFNSSVVLLKWAWFRASQISTSLYSTKGSKFFLRLDENKNGSEKMTSDHFCYVFFGVVLYQQQGYISKTFGLKFWHFLTLRNDWYSFSQMV